MTASLTEEISNMTEIPSDEELNQMVFQRMYDLMAARMEDPAFDWFYKEILQKKQGKFDLVNNFLLKSNVLVYSNRVVLFLMENSI